MPIRLVDEMEIRLSRIKEIEAPITEPDPKQAQLVGEIVDPYLQRLHTLRSFLMIECSELLDKANAAKHGSIERIAFDTKLLRHTQLLELVDDVFQCETLLCFPELLSFESIIVCSDWTAWGFSFPKDRDSTETEMALKRAHDGSPLH